MTECPHCKCCRLIAGVIRDTFVCRACGRCFGVPRTTREKQAKGSKTQMAIDQPLYARPSGILSCSQSRLGQAHTARPTA